MNQRKEKLKYRIHKFIIDENYNAKYKKGPKTTISRIYASANRLGYTNHEAFVALTELINSGKISKNNSQFIAVNKLEIDDYIQSQRLKLNEPKAGVIKFFYLQTFKTGNDLNNEIDEFLSKRSALINESSIYTALKNRFFNATEKQLQDAARDIYEVSMR